MISAKIGHSLDPAILRIYRAFLKSKIINPNTLTVWGAFFGFAAFVSIALDHLIIGGILLLVSGFFDLMDGAIARTTNSITAFGGFLDSVLDRYTDLLVMLGIFIHFLRHGETLYSVMVFIAAIGTAVIPYARARAEAASLRCNTGVLERPERLVIILLGLFFPILGYAVIFLAVLTHVTVIQRMIFVKRQS